MIAPWDASDGASASRTGANPRERVGDCPNFSVPWEKNGTVPLVAPTACIQVARVCDRSLARQNSFLTHAFVNNEQPAQMRGACALMSVPGRSSPSPMPSAQRKSGRWRDSCAWTERIRRSRPQGSVRTCHLAGPKAMPRGCGSAEFRQICGSSVCWKP
jgi:hypothetical protein